MGLDNVPFACDIALPIHVNPKNLINVKQDIDVKAPIIDGKEKYEVKLCFDIVLYYNKEGFIKNREGILHFYENSIDLIKDKLTYHYVDGRRGRVKKVTKKTFDLLPFWASDEAGERGIYGLVLESGNFPESMSEMAFQLYDDEIDPGWIRLILPIETIEDGAHQLIELAKRLPNKLKFLSGSAGFAVNMRQGYPSASEYNEIYKISRRYKGIDLGSPLMFSGFMKEGIKCVNWLTFVGNRFVERLGGVEHLQKQVSDEIIIHTLPHGIMIQAGALPSFGYVNAQENLPYYHEVGRLLKPIRSLKHTERGFDEIGGTENTAEWLARFD